MAKICEYCGKELADRTGRARFCSVRCRVYFNRAAKNSRNINAVNEAARSGNPAPMTPEEAVALWNAEHPHEILQIVREPKKNRTASPLQQERAGAARSFQELLQAAKGPLPDREGLEAEVRESKALTPNQREMLFAKLKNA